MPYADESLFWTNGCPLPCVTCLRELPILLGYSVFLSSSPCIHSASYLLNACCIPGVTLGSEHGVVN